jgi:alkanesulfonate monooxygenase SsuD/methylene tetrahydromethanopterin reductase-like flavin-dependent oxidoreductase (luciferase family)
VIGDPRAFDDKNNCLAERMTENRRSGLSDVDGAIRKIEQLYAAGIDAVLMVLDSYYDDLARFEREIMPGLRALKVIA